MNGAGIGCADHTPSMIQLSPHGKLCHRTCNSAVVAWAGTRGLSSRVHALSLAGPVVPLWWVGKKPRRWQTTPTTTGAGFAAWCCSAVITAWAAEP